MYDSKWDDDRLLKLYKRAQEENHQLEVAEAVIREQGNLPMALSGIQRAISNNRWYMNKLLQSMTEEQILSIGYKRTEADDGTSGV